MKKYKLYRSLGDLDQHVKQHELVAIENGKDDLQESEEYRNFKATAYAPEPVNTNIRRVKRYDYEMLGIVMPTNADKNILIDYGIIEEDAE